MMNMENNPDRDVCREARVLIAEDNAMLALDLVGNLQQVGIGVVGPVASLRRAARVVDDAHFSLAVLDWNLLDGTSDQIAMRLEAKGIPFVFYTSDSEGVRALWPDKLVFDKPYGLKDMLVTIQQLMARGSCDCWYGSSSEQGGGKEPEVLPLKKCA